LLGCNSFLAEIFEIERADYMKTDKVWVTTAGRDGSLVQTNIGHDPNEPARLAISRGEEPSEDERTVTAFAEYADSQIGELPDVFVGAGSYVISGEIADILLGFELERTLLLPLRLFQYDRKTEVNADRRFHLISRFSVAEALAPEESPRLQPSPYSNPPQLWSLPWEPKDGDVAVKQMDLDSPALWHDPKLVGCYFFNGEVVEALEDAGFAHHWGFKECRIIK